MGSVYVWISFGVTCFCGGAAAALTLVMIRRDNFIRKMRLNDQPENRIEE